MATPPRTWSLSRFPCERTIIDPTLNPQLQSPSSRKACPELAVASQDPHDDAPEHAPVEMASQSAAEIATAPACAPAAVGPGEGSGSVAETETETETETEAGVNEERVTDGREPKRTEKVEAVGTMVQRLSRRLSERKQQVQLELQQLVHRRWPRLGKYRFVRGAAGGSEANRAKDKDRSASEEATPAPASGTTNTILTRRAAAHIKNRNSRPGTFVGDRDTKPMLGTQVQAGASLQEDRKHAERRPLTETPKQHRN